MHNQQYLSLLLLLSKEYLNLSCCLSYLRIRVCALSWYHWILFCSEISEVWPLVGRLVLLSMAPTCSISDGCWPVVLFFDCSTRHSRSRYRSPLRMRSELFNLQEESERRRGKSRVFCLVGNWYRETAREGMPLPCPGAKIHLIPKYCSKLICDGTALSSKESGWCCPSFFPYAQFAMFS